jgi:oligopeptide/dipeptide ABC transporter ATP-binding protein
MGLLDIRGLKLSFDTDKGNLQLFQSVDLSIPPKEILGIVGESGSGKSTLGYTIVRLLPTNAKVLAGEITFEGKSLTSMSESEMRTVRGRKITMVFQDPATALNPVFRIKDQLLRVIEDSIGLKGIPARQHAIQLLKEVELPDPEIIMDSFPFELSGGMQQRVMLAMAFSSSPKLIIADEPTSAVDATIQMQILRLLRRLRTEREFSMILITHSIAVAEEVCDRIAVMYAGDIVELGKAQDVIQSPKHPYTEALVKCIPTIRKREAGKVPLPVVEGQVPELTAPPTGCRFHPRCPYVMDICSERRPDRYQVEGSEALCFLHQNGGMGKWALASKLPISANTSQ